jgi:hypothetical protein
MKKVSSKGTILSAPEHPFQTRSKQAFCIHCTPEICSIYSLLNIVKQIHVGVSFCVSYLAAAGSFLRGATPSYDCTSVNLFILLFMATMPYEHRVCVLARG